MLHHLNLPSTWYWRLVLCLGLCFLALFAATPALAKDFKADYTVDYTLNPTSGLTHVKQRVVLTNQAPNLRASSYSLTLENNGYKNLTASDSQGKLKFTETKGEDGSPTITFTFNDRVVGTGNQLRWTIEYDSTSLAHHQGNIWDISIPRVKEHPSYDIAAYDVNLIIPKSAGNESYLSPSPASTAHNGSEYRYVFNKDLVLPTGIVGAFGNAQIFQFSLKYHLQNPNLGQASTEIALPSDIQPYQQIIYDKLEPAPVSLRTDEDGNTLATYYLKSQQKLDVSFSGWARILSARPNLNSPKLADALPRDLVEHYTVEQKYWETSDPTLIKKVKEITDPKKPVSENARAIYDYVTATLQYNTARINKDLKRMGALAAYKSPKDAVCMEFTDLFITMARIAGIPAREVDGYAYTADSSNQPIFYPGLGSDILHAWAQVYLPEAGWVPVDATWGSTTGGVDYFGRVDMNRIAFAVKGRSSQQPYAAGSYKTDDKQDGDVQVTFAKEDHTGEGGLDVQLDDRMVIAGIGNSVPVVLKNTGNAALYNVWFSAEMSGPLRLGNSATNAKITLLPGQTVTQWLPLKTASWLDRSEQNLPINVRATSFSGETREHKQDFTMQVSPFFMNVALPIVFLLLLVVFVAWGSWIGLHRLYRQQEKGQPKFAEALRPVGKAGGQDPVLASSASAPPSQPAPKS
jgi:transglutaminase-like putative cysteine protease